MKYVQKRLRLAGRLAIVGGIFLGLFLAGYYLGFLRENCKEDTTCFNERASMCRPSDLVVMKQNTVYVYSVGSSIGDCHLSVTLKRVDAGAPVEFQNLEGEKMTCSIPKQELEGFNMERFDQYMGYCHGLLKEKLYELLLTRVYSHLIGNMDEVLREAETALKK